MGRLSQPNTYHRSEMSSKLEAKLQELRDELELLTSMVRAERLTATAANQQCTDEQGERAHKVLDQCIAFASVPQQDVGAGRSVPSPVGQEQQPLFTEAQVKAMVDDIKVIAAENAHKCYTNRIEQMTPPAPVAFHIDNYMWKKHGIKL